MGKLRPQVTRPRTKRNQQKNRCVGKKILVSNTGLPLYDDFDYATEMAALL
jgi:hypothetical protein